ncbi:hypothetical protein [Maribacter halichondriae]|uniref:hypothetical protein n=1 Tax=Maribacter halichondriae TaxID=2980554 RepID=UPI002359C198|nr:hypothetical protein [Maribacter sp. Hal144]
MDKETDKKLDDFTRKLFCDVSQEVPSFDFTTRVMVDVEAVTRAKQVGYKPLISKKGWVLTALLTVGIFSYLLFGNIETGTSFGSYFDIIPFHKLKTFTLPSFEISKVVFYGVVTFAFFVGIQILLLKQHFDKRYAS